jgi:hypothetical protein
MPLPAAVTTVSVHGEIVSPDGGAPAAGRVHFRIPVALRDTTDNVIIGPQTVTAELDDDGEFTIALIATDDPDISPSDWVYDVRVETSVWRDRFDLELPASPSSVEFADLAPAVTPPAVVTYALASDVIAESLVDAKGDLLVATAADTVTRLAVGSNDQVLTADSAQPTGVKWAAAAGGVPTSRQVIAGTGLTGGGDLSADRTFTVAYGSSSTTAARGDDARLSDARTPTAHAATHASAGADPVTVAQSQVTDLSTDLAGKVALSTVDAKGDLLAGTADNTLARVAVGTNGQALVADSAQSTGVAWATVVPLDPYAVKFGLQVVTMPDAAVADDFALNSGVAVYVLCHVPRAVTLTHLGVWVVTAGATDGGNNTMAVYSQAGARLGITGEMDLTATGWREGALTASLDLAAGNYYLHLLTTYGTAPNIATSASSADRLAVNTALPSIFHTGQASSPASITPGSLTVNSVAYYLGGR